MSDNNNNKIIKKIHNPKAYSPAVYIPCWLIQVPSRLLSHQAKILYGRLAQWANSDGRVFRSVPQLSEEVGCSKSTIDRTIKELKEASLIGTYHLQAGGVNHFEFYDHPWMYEPINEHLSYKKDDFDPTSDVTAPHVRCDVTPTSDVTRINIKEIKINKIINKNTKKNKFDVSEMLEDNPHGISEEELHEWKNNRKKPITERIWKKTNKVMSEIKSKHGIEPKELFERMLERQWQGMEINYFSDMIKPQQAKSTSNNAYSKWRSKTSGGTDYDQFGNVVDPFRF